MLNAMGIGITLSAKDSATAVLNKVNATFGRLDRGASAAAASVASAGNQIRAGLGLMGAGAAGLSAAFGAAVVGGRLQSAIAEVATLVDEATFSTQALTKASVDLSSQYGGTAAGQAKALYQVVSAGITDATKATELLAVANELAIGGVTNTRVAVDGLTNVVNAYAKSGAQARDVADAFFVAIRAGKTTAEELAGSIGRVAPVAAELGVSFHDLLGSVSAITTKGLATSEAVSGLKAAFANIIKPSSDAAAEARRLGISFDAATIRAKGLPGLMNMITSSAGFTQDSMAKLFPSVEGLNAMLALSSNNGAAFNGVLGQMADRAGAARNAFRIMSDTFTQKFGVFKDTLLDAVAVVGGPFANVFSKGLDVVNAALGAFIRLVNDIPGPVKDTFAQIAIAIGGIVTGFGAFLAAKGAIIAGVFALKLFGGAIAAAAVAFAPFAVALGAGLLLFKALQVNAAQGGQAVGGLGAAFKKVGLFMSGIGQLFSSGGFSGEVMKDMNKAENSGVKAFAIKVFTWVGRIKNFLKGLSEGFKERVGQLGPVFDTVIGAVKGLAEAFGISFGNAKDNATAYDQAGVAGKGFGKNLADVAGIVGQGLTVALQTATAMVGWLRKSWEIAGPSIMGAVDMIGGGLQFVVGLLKGDWTAVWHGAVRLVIGAVIKIVEVVGGMVGAVTSAIDGLGSAFGKDWGLSRNLKSEIDAMKSGLLDARDFAIGSTGRGFVAPAGGQFRFDQQHLAPNGIPVSLIDPRDPGVVGAGAPLTFPALAAPDASPSAAFVERVTAPATGDGGAKMADALARTADALSKVSDRPIQVTTQIDGEAVARAVARAEKRLGTRRFE